MEAGAAVFQTEAEYKFIPDGERIFTIEQLEEKRIPTSTAGKGITLNYDLYVVARHARIHDYKLEVFNFNSYNSFYKHGLKKNVGAPRGDKPFYTWARKLYE